MFKNFGDSITVNWGGANNSAQIKANVINDFGCPDFVNPFNVKVFKQLDTEIPKGLDTLKCNLLTNTYGITNTNGSTYDWNVIGGLVKSGNGTNQVVVEWDASTKRGSLWIDESVNTELEICFGQSDSLKIVNPQAFGNENISLYSISSTFGKSDEVEINYHIQNGIFFEPYTQLYRKTLGDVGWQKISTLLSHDTIAKVDLVEKIDQEYLFQIKLKNKCGREVESFQNSNIFLKLKKDSLNETVRLEWNKPFGWKSVDYFSLYKKIDEGPFLFSEKLSGGFLSKDINTTLDGFQFEYYIIGSSTELSAQSISNETATSFEHMPFIPNVITPNEDGFNDYFVIQKIEPYPENYLNIFNRYGQIVYSIQSYQNNWSGQDLPSGTYFYEFKTAKFNRYFKGWVQIIK